MATTTDTIFEANLKICANSTDALEMLEQSAFWAYQHDQFGRGAFHGTTLAVHTNRLQLTLCHRSPGIFIRGNCPQKTTMIAFPIGSCQLPYYRGQRMKHSQIIALDHHEEIELQTPEPNTILGITVSSSLLEEYCQTLTGKTFSSLNPLNSLQMTELHYQTCTRHLIPLLKLLHARKQPIQGNEEQTIENEVMETLFRGLNHLQTIVPRPDRIHLAGNAEKFIRANLKNQLSIRAICRFTGTSERSLRMGFQERYGVSPKAFIQMMRLNGARKELLAHNPVTETALSRGFGHLGCFSRQYQEMFGELPGTTRKKTMLQVPASY